MPVVTQSCPSVKTPRFTPLQLMVVTAVSKRTVNLAELLRNLLWENVSRLVDLTLLFMSTAPTPQGMWDFECRLADQLREAGRELLQFAVNHLEPEEAEDMPHRVRRGPDEYSRKGRKTRHRGGVASRFGMLELWRWSYEPLSEESDSGLKSMAPLAEQLGLVAGKATPALAEVIGRLSQERSESGVGEVLRREHHVTLAAETVCLVRDAVARGIAQHLEDEQVRVLLEAIRAGQAQGQVILSAGRDGIFVPLRGVKDDRWKEAAVGTVSVYVKPLRGELRRLGTVYLGGCARSVRQNIQDLRVS